MQTEPILHYLADDGIVPNNSDLPLVLYRRALPAHRQRAQEILALFDGNGWGAGWINGIYDFQHYHSNAHEVLGIVAGGAAVQFGGASGPVLTVAAGDVVIIPAGVGHCRKSDDRGLVVVGAYPRGQENVDLMRAAASDHAAALARIRAVPLPGADPVHGTQGPLLSLWPTGRKV